MKVFTCFLLLTIFAYTYSVHLSNTQNAPKDSQRSVNLALETVLEFNNKDHSADVQFLDNVQKFITKVRTVIDRNKNLRRAFRAVQSIENFTDFIQEFIAVLNTYPDPEFLDVFDILDEEIRKYHYRGCKFYELTENYEIRKLLATKLDLIRGKPVYAIKSYINYLSKVLKEARYERYVKDLLDYINSLYREDAREKFKKVLTDFEHLNKSKGKRSTTDIIKVIRDGIRTIIFDHYTNLNPNARRELKSKIETFWKQYNTVKYNENPVIDPKITNVAKVENFKTEIKVPENNDVDIKKTVTVDKTDPRNVVVKNEENQYTENTRGESKKKENHLSDGKRIEIKKSDYKTPGHMRDGIHGTKLKESRYEKNKAYKFTHTKKESGNIESHSQGNIEYTDVIITTSRKDQRIHHPTTKKASTNQLLRSFSTEEAISGETFEDNSIEFEQEEQAQIENAPQRYITLYPEPINLKKLIKKNPDKVIHRSKKIHTLPQVVTLWVEESTGRLPGATREPASKPHQKSKHNPDNKSDRKKHKSENKHKDSLRHKTKKHKKKVKHPKDHPKLRTKSKNNKPMLISENNALIDVKVTGMEMYEFKKMMAPITIVIKSRTTPTPKTTHTTKKIKVPVESVTKFIYAKRNRLLPQNKLRDFRKSVFPYDTNEGLSIEEFKRHKTRTSLRKNNKNETEGTVDQSVINRINELERELKDVKSKIQDVKLDEVNVREDKYETKGKQFEATPKKDKSPEDSNPKNDRSKDNKENKVEFKTELKVTNGKETKFDEKKENKEAPERKDDVPREKTIILENKVDNNNAKVSKDKVTNNDAKETKIPNDKYIDQKTKETKEDIKVKLVNEDKQPDNKMQDEVGNNIYDDVDEWKDAFKSRMKFTNTKGTTTTLKTTTQTETTTAVTTEKNTEETTITTKVEIFIPVSIPAEYMPHKPSNVIRKDEGKILNLENTAKFVGPVVRPVINISDMAGDNKDIENEVRYMFKMNNITIPKDDDKTMPETEAAGDLEFSQADIFNQNSLPQMNGNDSAANIIFTDPFRGEDELDFLKP